MSEYICNTEDKCGMCEAYKTAEPIVRCRDCKFYGCYDGSTWCRRTYEQVPSGTCDYQTVEPYGFCAWGERKSEGE